jgi:branched-chain amino acid transport system permease protein
MTASKINRVAQVVGVLIALPILVFSVWALIDNTRLYLLTLLNGLTLASLYFIVASGFTLVFGLMRNVNLAHGSLYLLGGYVGFVIAEKTGYWLLAIAGGFAASAVLGLLMQIFILRHMQGQDLRQTMVTIGLSIVIADLMLWGFSAEVHQMEAPDWLQGPIKDIPIIRAYSAYRLSLIGFGLIIGLALWWLLNRTKVGAMIRAGVDDRGMLAAAGVNVNFVFAITFMLGAGLAGLGGVSGAVYRAWRRHAFSVGVDGGGDRRRHGQYRWRSHWCSDPGFGRSLWLGLCAHLQRGLHLCDFDLGAGL